MFNMRDRTRRWIRAAIIRAIKTVAQTMAGTMSAASMFENVDWKLVVSSGLLAGLISLLTSIAGLPEVDIETQPEPSTPQPPQEQSK
jgi:uncharacterized membrane protein